MDISKAFIAEESGLTFYNGKAVIDLPVYFYTDENKLITLLDDDDDETAFDFTGYVSAYLYVYDEREGQLLKSFTTQITRNANILVLNCSVSDMTFENLGTYYFELGYNRSGYEFPLRYGTLKII